MFMSQAHLDSQAKYSTEIRRAIDSGNIEKAMTMLEREGTNKINVQVSSFNIPFCGRELIGVKCIHTSTKNICKHLQANFVSGNLIFM